MAKKKDGLLPVFIVMAALLVVSIGFLAGYNAWVNRELTPEEDAAQVAIVYNDNDGNSQSITKGEVQDAYTEAATMYQMNYGTTSGYESQILNEALSAAISDRIVPLKAQELGLDEVTDEERATMEETAQSQLDSTVDSYIASYLTEEQQALSEEEQRQIALDALAAEGVDFDYAYEQQLSALYETRVFEAVTADVTPTDEELHTYYEEQLASDTEMYDEAWYYALTAQYGQTSLWAPEGVRIVKHILLDPGEELKEAYSTASSALNSALSSIENTQAEIAELEAEINGTDETAEDAAAEATATPAPTATLDPSATPEPSPEEQLAAAQAELEELNASLPDLEAAAETARADCIAAVQDTLDEIQARLAAGEDFEALIAEYGQDPGMEDSDGYYVAEGAINWVSEFTDGAMALANVGDVSEPIVSASGVHLIRYMSDVTPGATSEEDAHDYLVEVVTAQKKNEVYQEKLGEWMTTEYEVTVYSDVVSDIG